MPEIRANLTRPIRRRLGLALLAYGVAGIVLLAAFGAIANEAIGRLALADPAGGSLADASLALGDAATAFTGFGTSLTDAERAVNQASTSARDGSVTASRLADGMTLSIFGAQPFLSLSQDFRREAADLDTMATSLQTLARSIHANQNDVGRIQNDLVIMKTRLDSARTTGLSADVLRPLLVLLVLWLALPALAAIAAGMWLVRSVRR